VLLVLDAVTGGEAARLYQRLGWCTWGTSPAMPCCRGAGSAARRCTTATSAV